MWKNNFYKLKKIVFICLIFFSNPVKAEDAIRLFPLKNYDQNINNFLNPSSPDYNTSLMSNDVINERIANYKEHLYGELSPWSESFVANILNITPPDDVQSIEIFLFNYYRQGCDTDAAESFSENFHPYSCEWFDNKILKNMNLSQLKSLIKYNKSKKAIATDNILARAFPTNEPLFSNYKLAGQGYPFDNLQVSAIWLGSPLYILGQTNDGLWSLIVTGSTFIAWVPTQKIGLVDDEFISKYIQCAHNYGLRIITHTEANIKNENLNTTFTNAYIGSIFPSENRATNKILIPRRKKNGFAQFVSATVELGNSAVFPLSPTPHNFAHIFNELIGRPYGWGGIYFYNDCSQETQSIFTTFGIWLPRFSADQVNVGEVEDLSAKSTADRIKLISTDAHKLVTLVYIKGHIMLYVGNYDYFGNLAPTIYNDIWGFRTPDNSYRSIIGRTAFLPLFESFLYPEDKNLISLADSQYKPIFQLSFLDKLPPKKSEGFYRFLNNFPVKINIRRMILPSNLQ